MVALPELVSPTVAAIERAVEATGRRDFDPTIRASSIGHACERHLFYRFRWAHEPETFEPRMLRLFNTGNVEEGRMIAWLRQAGVTIEDRDPETGHQWRVKAVDGHLVGHCDGKATGIIEAPVTPHLLECKTHNARSFAQLVKHGVGVAKPEHVAQMQLYMHLFSLGRAFYLAKNKDTDELYGERLKYDADAALRLIAKAERIKGASIAPPRISNDPDSFQCRFCSSADLCHRGEWPLENCRTCLHSTPVENGHWRCDRFGHRLSLYDQKAGCPSHLFLPSLVPGEQSDATEKGGHLTTVLYRMPDGSEWRDGAP